MGRFKTYLKQLVRMFTGILYLKGGYQQVKTGQRTPNFKKAESIWPNIFKLTPLEGQNCKHLIQNYNLS